MRRFGVPLWPRGLAGRTVLLLLASLTLFHVGSLWLHRHEARGTLAELGEARVVERLLAAGRAVAALPADGRDHVAHSLSGPGLSLSWDTRPLVASDAPPDHAGPALALGARLADAEPAYAAGRLADGAADGVPVVRGSLPAGGGWLNLVLAAQGPAPGGLGDGAVASTSVMAVGIVAASVLLVRWLTGPLRRLAQAADRIGRGRGAVEVPQHGPEEVRRVARALDAMQARLTRLVDDRTQALAAVSHDLRTPITRLRLRAGFLDDAEMQARIEADLDEMEAMIAATLAYLQGEAEAEAEGLTDVAVMLSTLCHAASDAGGAASYEGPAHLLARCRPTALRRAASNLIGNALKYGTTARVRLAAQGGGLRIEVEDDGPGIPAGELERVFEPFVRLEASRNRGSGGVGLGLTIARQAIEEQGGRLSLANRDGGGLRATIHVPHADGVPLARDSRASGKPAHGDGSGRHAAA